MPAGKNPKPSLARALGQFVGHLWKGAATTPQAGQPRRQVLRHDVEEEHRDTPEGSVTLRRTTIEEVELHGDTTPPPPGPAPEGRSAG